MYVLIDIMIGCKLNNDLYTYLYYTNPDAAADTCILHCPLCRDH